MVTPQQNHKNSIRFIRTLHALNGLQSIHCVTEEVMLAHGFGKRLLPGLQAGTKVAANVLREHHEPITMLRQRALEGLRS